MKKSIIMDVISLVLGLIVTVVFCYLAFTVQLYTVSVIVALVGIAAIICEIIAIRQKLNVKEIIEETEVDEAAEEPRAA